jgi:predicted Zn-dependent peptidase
MPSLESVCVTIWVRVGSRHEEEKTAGIAHFLEHMTFKGGKIYKNASEVSIALETLGASYNASTSREWTDFYVKVRKSDLDRAFEILSDMILTPRFNASDIERERGVIIEELAMSEDVPSDKVGDIFMERMYKGNALARDIAGSKKTVKKIGKEDFKDFRDKHYHTGNMLISVAGGVTEKEVKNTAEKYFSGVHTGDYSIYETFTFPHMDTQIALHYKKTEQAHVVIGYPGFKRGHTKRYAENMLVTVLGRGMSSRLFTEVREKRALAYSVGSSISRFMDTGLFDTYAGVDPSKIEETIKVILDEHNKLTNPKTGKISKAELSKAKEYMKGRSALALEDSSAVNDFFGQRALFAQVGDKIETPEEVFKKIDEVKVEELYDVARELFDPKKLVMAIVGPYKDEEKFLGLVD